MKQEPASNSEIETPSRHELANAIRALSMDAVQKANSGHPGAPMGMADIAEVLWNDFLRHNPSNPNWINRDRFIMSNGHGSMLLYSILHLTGYDLDIDDLKQFRQLHSKTPGHPEYGYTPGVETTTGPLGQGLANAVGMAIAESVLAAQYNQPGHDIIDHFTYVSVGDGCLMEGISHEACSLAGTLGLGKLITLFDSNQISIDGDVSGWFTDDHANRFRAYGWHVIENVDGHDPDAIRDAIQKAQTETHKPSFIILNTIIGMGSPNKQGKESSHGAPLGDDEIVATRAALGWEHPPFEIPDTIYRAWDAKLAGKQREQQWNQQFVKYQQAFPELAEEFNRRIAGELPVDWPQQIQAYIDQTADKAESIASRKASQNALNAIGPLLTELIGGSADLAGSNLTIWSGSNGIQQQADGNYIYYGVREFAMTAINNGIALHGGFIPYGATFLMFSEYARNALRMSALMKIRNISIFTHDSIGLGEDGPTHQAVEQAATLRLMPNMTVWRPCDAVESAVAWKAAVENTSGPSSLLFSRQGLQHIERTEQQISDIEKGGYVLLDSGDQPELIVIATGSEIGMAYNVSKRLNEQGHNIRLVSMPSTDKFDQQDKKYQQNVLPSDCKKRIAVEAGISDYWRKYVGLDGEILGVDTFGESAPASDVFKQFGLTEEKLTDMIQSMSS